MFKKFFNFISLLILICLFNSQLVAQQSPVVVADSVTYALYLQANWQQLRTIGNLQIDQGIDFYYLRMRLGIAEFELKDYTQAEKHFKKALSFLPSDETALYYMYISNLQTKRIVEAGSILNRMSLKNQFGMVNDDSYRSFVPHMDIGYTFRSNQEGSSFNKLSGADGFFGQERVYRNNLFYDIGGFFRLTPNLLMYAGIQWIDVPIIDRVAFLEAELNVDTIINNQATLTKDYYYEVFNTPVIREFDQELKQRTFYFQSQWAPSSKVHLIMGLNINHVEQGFINTGLEDYQITDTFYVDNLNNAILGTIDLQRLTFENIPWEVTDYSFSLNGRVHLGKVSLLGGFAVATISDQDVSQFQAGYLWMPFGNLNFYNQSELFYVDSPIGQNFVFKSMLGTKISKRLWLDAALITGEMNMLSDQYGYVVYNHLDKQLLKMETSFIYVLDNRVHLQLKFAYTEGNRKYFRLDGESNGIMDNYYSITTQTIVGGIKWNF